MFEQELSLGIGRLQLRSAVASSSLAGCHIFESGNDCGIGVEIARARRFRGRGKHDCRVHDAGLHELDGSGGGQQRGDLGDRRRRQRPLGPGWRTGRPGVGNPVGSGGRNARAVRLRRSGWRAQRQQRRSRRRRLWGELGIGLQLACSCSRWWWRRGRIRWRCRRRQRRDADCPGGRQLQRGWRRGWRQHRWPRRRRRNQFAAPVQRTGRGRLHRGRPRDRRWRGRCRLW